MGPRIREDKREGEGMDSTTTRKDGATLSDELLTCISRLRESSRGGGFWAMGGWQLGRGLHPHPNLPPLMGKGGERD